jgi:histone-lysine N-methyltransferase SETMAR
MAASSVSATVEQRCVIKFLVKENVKPAEILRRLQAQYGEQTMSRATVYEWCEQFREGRELVTNEAHGHIRPTAVTPVNIARVEQVILQNRQVTVRDIAAEVNISVGSVETIIHEHLRFRKVCARWVPRQLTFDQKWTRMKVSEQLLNRFRAEGDEFLQSIITCDETWLHNFTPETKRSSMEWRHKGSPPPKKSKTQPSAGKSMGTVFWDMNGVIHVDFLENGVTINAQYYCKLLTGAVRKSIRKKRPGMLSGKVILLHDNARPHTANLTTTTLAKMRWEVLPHPPYSPDLAPSDYHLFGPLKEHLGGKKFTTDEALQNDVLQWLRQQPSSFYTKGIRELPQRWQRCLDTHGEYFEKLT